LTRVRPERVDAVLFAPEYRVVDGLRVRYASGGAPSGRPILFTSPWPESIYAFRALWAKLGDRAPLFALDLPGFGRSEGRPNVMNPAAMGDFILKVMSEFSLERPHVVAPDVGTSAVLYAAAAKGDAFTSLTVGGGAMDESQVTGALKDIVEAPDMSAFEGADGADIVGASIVRLMSSKPPDEELTDYRASYAGDRFVKSAAYVRSYPEYLPPLRAMLKSIETPVQVLYGSRDPLVPPSNADVLARFLPHVHVVALDSGHLAWEDATEQYAAALLSWTTEGYVTA
jgi:pimeloyl-ACP methyl ester carboxylesterase